MFGFGFLSPKSRRNEESCFHFWFGFFTEEQRGKKNGIKDKGGFIAPVAIRFVAECWSKTRGNVETQKSPSWTPQKRGGQNENRMGYNYPFKAPPGTRVAPTNSELDLQPTVLLFLLFCGGFRINKYQARDTKQCPFPNGPLGGWGCRSF